mgnify:CR=1 FL=1
MSKYNKYSDEKMGCVMAIAILVVGGTGWRPGAATGPIPQWSIPTAPSVRP